MQGLGSAERTLTDDEARTVVESFCESQPLDGRRVLLLIPDGTRHAPIPLLFRLLTQALSGRVRSLDVLVALGTHPAMAEEALDRLVGMGAEERERRAPGVRIHNHAWQDPAALVSLGSVPAGEAAALTGGLLDRDVPVRLNRMVEDADLVLICGPVFPHEVAGFSGGAKYLFPGVAGAEIIDATHWLGALVTNVRTIGVQDTPVRRIIHRAAELVPTPVLCLAMAVRGERLHGLWGGGYEEAWRAAADLSAQLHVVEVARPLRRVLSMPSTIYDDLWTGAKAMYKLEPAVADGGEIVIFAPHLGEVSYTHGRLIDEVGYHVRDYFTKQEQRFRSVPGTIKAHSTHVKGAGTYDPDTGEERPRIQVTLATAIPEERCRRINLGYLDPDSIRIEEWEDRESEGVLVVREAGEQLYRLRA